jgi:conjugative transfer signal peptidase TraF
MTAPRPGHPRLLWNVTPSVPIGLYWIASAAPIKGQLAVVRLPDPLRLLTAIRGYLPATALLIKPVAAGPGDLVCRRWISVTINGRLVAHARTSDRLRRPLPRWNGCTILGPEQIFLLAAAPDSFDGRYVGPIDRGHVIGTTYPVWPNALDDGPRAVPHQRGSPHALVHLSLLEPLKRVIHL